MKSTLQIRNSAVFIVLAAAIINCMSLGEAAGQNFAPKKAKKTSPMTAQILSDLRTNDAAITSFRAGGKFTLESPKLKAIRKFRRGSVRFRRPDSLYVQGNHHLTLIPLFKLTCVGSEFLMEFPRSKDDSFYQIDGEEFEDVPFSVSPSDIAREMFLPETWSELSDDEIRLVGYEESTRIATLTVGDPDRPRRAIDVAPMDADTPKWVIIRNIRLDEDGNVLAITALEDYRVVSGVRVPGRVTAEFPTEQTRMVLNLHNYRVNIELEDSDFDIQERVRELGLIPVDSAVGADG